MSDKQPIVLSCPFGCGAIVRGDWYELENRIVLWHVCRMLNPTAEVTIEFNSDKPGSSYDFEMHADGSIHPVDEKDSA